MMLAHWIPWTFLLMAYAEAMQSPNPARSLMKRSAVEDTEACWIETRARGAGRPISDCEDGWERSQLLCYPKCADGYKGIGPVCWDFPKSYGRGVGKPLGCKKGTRMEGLLCYKECPPEYDGVGPLCWSRCPASKPYRCGLLCTRDEQQCTSEVMTLTMSGFSVLYGIGTIGSAVATLFGTAGLATVISAFGLVNGIGTMGAGVSGVIKNLLDNPFCVNDDEKELARKRMEKAKSKCQSMLEQTCKMSG